MEVPEATQLEVLRSGPPSSLAPVTQVRSPQTWAHGVLRAAGVGGS